MTEGGLLAIWEGECCEERALCFQVLQTSRVIRGVNYQYVLVRRGQGNTVLTLNNNGKNVNTTLSGGQLSVQI